MNHISKNFTSSGGRAYKCHSWELREGGYRRIALLVGNGVWPASEETRLLRFLLDRGFRVLALDIAYGASAAPRIALSAFREAMGSLARAIAEPMMPLYLLASSFSAGAVLPIAGSMPDLAAIALLGPVVEFPPPKLKKSFFLSPSAELAVRSEDLCGEGEVPEALASRPAVMRFRKRDLKAAASDLALTLAEGFAIPVAAFTGDADPFITHEGRNALARSGARIYGYPRVRHEPGRDRYADNYYADLGSFLDEVESVGKKGAGS
jgi:alpha-beta hydrolase superfamily lysophospholipase